MSVTKYLTSLGAMATLTATGLGCAMRPVPIAQDRGIDRPDRSVVVFFVDGMSRSTLDQMVAQGQLPNIGNRFIRGGVAVDRAIASLPSITYPNTVSILTGQFPGHHGVLGNQWFDRHAMRFRDYGTATTYQDVNGDFRRLTIYETLGDRLSVSVQNHTSRGATINMDNRMASGIDWLLHRFSSVDRRVGRCIGRVVHQARHVRRWPAVLLFYFPGVDEIGHRFGPESRPYAKALRVVDEAIGSVFMRLEAEGVADDTYFVLVSDHGIVPHPAERIVDLVGWLRHRLGWRVWHEGRLSRDRSVRCAQLAPYNAVVINGAYRRLAIHIRGPHGWADPPSNEQIERLVGLHAATSSDPAGRPGGLLNIPGVDLIGIPLDSHRARIVSCRGTAIVERRIQGNVKSYRLIHPDQRPSAGSGPTADPLGYLEQPALRRFVQAGWHGSRAWLAATVKTNYPDLVPQIMEMFDSPRAGDLVVFAAENWSFAKVRGGHGSCLAADMVVPLYFTGPDLPAGGRIECARTVDIMPTILDLIGEHRRLSALDPIDGISIAPELRSAAP